MKLLPASADTPQQHDKPSPVLLIFLIFPLVGILAAVGLALSSQRSAAIATPAAVTLAAPTPTLEIIDRTAPPFHLNSLDGQTVRLSDYQGRIIFLNFWATWCEPCKRELPAFTAFSQQNQSAGSPVILAVNVMESADQINSFLNTLGGVSGFPILLDSDHAVADAYGVVNIPVTYVIDAQGFIRYPKYGEMTMDDLLAYIQALGK